MTTKIEWCQETWNPITGCTPISEGCKNCYAKKMSTRLRGRYGYPKDDPFRVTFHPDKLEQPLKWKKPQLIFVCSMGDLFHEAVTEDNWISIFEVIRKSIYNGGGVGHRFLILTKRPKVMQYVMESLKWNGSRLTFGRGTPFISLCGDGIWLGVTAENQKRFDERWTILDDIPAAVKFVSIEPMLCPVDIDIFAGWPNWVIAGCESGPGHRPAKTEWFRDLKNQCVDVNVPFFLKQMEVDGKLVKMPKLDGRVWDQYPR